MNTAADWYTALKKKSDLFEGSHNIHTPQKLVEEILKKITLADQKILVMFNLEFVVSLLHTHKINPKNITLLSDHENKTLIAKDAGINYITKLETDMKFDVVVGNPPYDKSTTTNSDKLWPVFLSKGLSLTNTTGYQSFITPPTFTSGTESVTDKGRKNLLKIFTTEHNLICLDYTAETHFNVGSRFVNSLVQVGVPYAKKTKIICTNGKEFEFDLSNVEALPLPVNITYDTVNKFAKMQQKIGDKFYFKFNSGSDIAYSDGKDQDHEFEFLNASSNHKNKWGNKKNCPGNYFVHMCYNGSKFKFDYVINSEVSVMHNARTWIIPEEYRETISYGILSSVFESDLFKETVWANKFGQYNEPCFINKIAIPPLNKIYTNSDLLKWYGL